jgi:hypothetical protein
MAHAAEEAELLTAVEAQAALEEDISSHLPREVLNVQR